MLGTKLEDAIWDGYLLKKVAGGCFPHAETLDSREQKGTYQIFEVLVAETIRMLYPDYLWHTTPAQGDGGVDFWGEQVARPMPEPFQMPSLVVYGQVKRKKSAITQEGLINATNKMIRFYLREHVQKKSLRQLIHVISSEKPLPRQIGREVQFKDSLIYVVTAIDATDLFRLWAHNPGFLQQILPEQGLAGQKRLFLEAVLSAYGEGPRPYDAQIPTLDPVYSGQPFHIVLDLHSRVPFPSHLCIVWIPDERSAVYLAAPQGLFQQYGGYPVQLLRSYRLTMRFQSAVPGIHSLGRLRVFANFSSCFEEIPLGEVEIRRALAPAYFELPNLACDERLRREIDGRHPGLTFYSVVGEGGIGKSTLLRETSNYAINSGYRAIFVEHPCELSEESDFWRELFQQLAGPSGGTLSINETLIEELREAMDVYYRESWTKALEALFQSGSLRQLGELMECWLCLTILAADSGPLFLWFSNMHWCSPAAIDLLRRYLKNLQRNVSFLANKLVIVFEGRTEETLPSGTIPYEWLDFQKSTLLQELRLQKWSEPQSRQYLDALLIRKDAGALYLEQCKYIRRFLLAYGNGNPMHLNELIRYLVQQNNLECCDDGRLRVISGVITAPEGNRLLDVIRSRTAYYRQNVPLLMDFLILGANLGDWPAFRQYAIAFHRRYDGNMDDTLYEMGFAVLDRHTGALAFVHENYQAAFCRMALLDDASVDACLNWTKSAGLEIPARIEARLRLLCRKIPYEWVCRRLLGALDEEKGDLAYFETLRLLEQIPSEFLEAQGMPLHRLYRLLESACMGMGNWETAERYVRTLKQLEGDSPAYQIDALFARKSLSNNYSFRMKFDCAREECEGAVAELESYLHSEPPMTSEQRRALKRELCMLKNRLSIIYYLTGEHEKAGRVDDDALKLARQEGDLYVQYHIQYEQGLRDLRRDPARGLTLIKEAYEQLPLVERLPGTQEMDLVRADLLMARLKVASVDGIFTPELLSEVKRDAGEGCRRLSNTREQVESSLYHTLSGIVAVIEGHLQEALRCFQTGAEIAYRASLIHMIWKMHLNIAQCYCLLLQGGQVNLAEEYQRNIHFHAQEARAVLERSLRENVLTRPTYQRVLELPIALAGQLAGGAVVPMLDGLASDYCGIQIGFQGYAFFLLD